MPVVNNGHAEKARHAKRSDFRVYLLQLSTNDFGPYVYAEGGLHFRHRIRFRQRAPLTGADIVKETGLPGQLIGPMPYPECLFISGGRRQIERIDVTILPALTLCLSHIDQRMGLMNEPDGRQLRAEVFGTAFMRIAQCCSPVHTSAPGCPAQQLSEQMVDHQGQLAAAVRQLTSYRCSGFLPVRLQQHFHAGFPGQ